MPIILDDETAWYPKGQTSLKENPADSLPLENNDNRDGGIVFSLGTKDMGALSRFLYGGRVLPLNRTSYFESVGINDTSLPEAILGEVDNVIGAYKTFRSLCAGFLGDPVTKGQKPGEFPKYNDDDFAKLPTWEKMKQVASDIYDYSNDAGSTDPKESSYALLLQWCKDYYAEGKSKEERDAIAGNIKDMCEDLLTSVEDLKSRAAQLVAALQIFRESCDDVAATLTGLEKSMATTLNEQLGNITGLEDKIKDQVKEISSYQAIVDKDRYDEAMVGAYVWIPVAGWVAGPVVFSQRAKEEGVYRGKIDALKDLIASEKKDILLHQTLQANVTSMKSQAEDLSGLFDPAMKTIGELQGGWDFMGVQLQYIYKNVASTEKKIPKVTFKLEKVAQEWLKLNKYVASYIQKAVITPSVVILSLEEYSQQLKDANPALD